MFAMNLYNFLYSIRFLLFFLMVKNVRMQILQINKVSDSITEIFKGQVGLAPLDIKALTGSIDLTSGPIITKAICRPATLIVDSFFTRIRQYKASEGEIIKELVDICDQVLVAKKATTKEVCDQMAEQIVPVFYFLARERPAMKASTWVGTFFQLAGCKYDGSLTFEDIQVSENLADTAEIPPSFDATTDSNELTKILHLSDLSIDPLYEPGANAVCKEKFVCCRHSSTDLKPYHKGSDFCGEYGDNRKCGTPWRMLNESLRHIAATHADAKMIFITGNIGMFSDWSSSKNRVADVTRKTIQMFSDYFPKARVVYTLGNWDTYPVQLFTPIEVKTERLGVSNQFTYPHMYVLVKKWNLRNDTKDTILEGGYYAVDVDKTLKLIVLNTNYPQCFNQWFMYNSNDGQLSWLVSELMESEKTGQGVYILGNLVPSHQQINRKWGKNFYQIVKRFKNTIRSQFYGNTHFDEFKLYYDDILKTPISVAWIAGGFTGYNKIRHTNPSYKVYYVDGNKRDASTWQVFDHQTWTLSLKQANKYKNESLPWKLLYSARDAYNLDDMTLTSLDRLVNYLATDLIVFAKYFRNYFKLTRANPECDNVCRKLVLCSIVQSFYGDIQQCKAVQEMVDGKYLDKVDVTTLHAHKYQKDALEDADMIIA